MSKDENNPEEFIGPYSVVCEHLDDKEVQYTPDPEKKSIFLSIKGSTALFNCTVRVNESDTLLGFLLRFPLVVNDEKYRTSTAELLTRANYGLPVGRFEFDFGSGDIRFHVHQFLGSFPLGKEIVDRIIGGSLRTADRYFPAIVQHLYAGVTPEDAVYAAELDYHAATVQEASS